MLQKAEHIKLQWGYHPPLSRDKPVALIVLQKPCHRKGAMEHNSKELKQESTMVQVARCNFTRVLGSIHG